MHVALHWDFNFMFSVYVHADFYCHSNLALKLNSHKSYTEHSVNDLL